MDRELFKTQQQERLQSNYRMGKGSEHIPHQRRYPNGNVIREMQTQTVSKYHYRAVRMAKIRNIGNTKCWQDWGTAGTLVHGW